MAVIAAEFLLGALSGKIVTALLTGHFERANKSSIGLARFGRGGNFRVALGSADTMSIGAIPRGFELRKELSPTVNAPTFKAPSVHVGEVTLPFAEHSRAPLRYRREELAAMFAW